jgi:hypothetical protein
MKALLLESHRSLLLRVPYWHAQPRIYEIPLA